MLPSRPWRVTAVALEVDGVLLADATADRAAWRWWARRAGLDPDTVAVDAAGRHARDVIGELTGTDDAAEAAIEARRRTLVRSVGRPRGTAGFVRALPPRRWAVVSAAGAELSALQLRRARISDPPVLVTADDASPGPPDPAPFLAAAEALRVRPDDVLVLAGTVAGAAAARASGATVIAVGPAGDVAGVVVDGTVPEPAGLRVRLVADGLEVSLGPPSPRVDPRLQRTVRRRRP